MSGLCEAAIGYETTRRWIRRYALAPWSDVAPSDLEPQGTPETEVNYRHEQHLLLRVRGTYGANLGMVGVRCLIGRAGELLPVGIAIPDGEDTSLEGDGA